jgi:aspartate aminotransferase-like enzyme
VPRAVGELVFDEPLLKRTHVSAEPGAVRESEGVNAAIGFAAPVGQVLVLPAAVGGEHLSGAVERTRVEPDVRGADLGVAVLPREVKDYVRTKCQVVAIRSAD